ncbi:hypothetical protein DFH11DRAFT_1731405 [Phellopilus nigrolimitatus]|nr:hypothetical protein DFH11DRAFT_1731405 [Phellopilus nigrolimitatus]
MSDSNATPVVLADEQANTRKKGKQAVQETNDTVYQGLTTRSKSGNATERRIYVEKKRRAPAASAKKAEQSVLEKAARAEEAKAARVEKAKATRAEKAARAEEAKAARAEKAKATRTEKAAREEAERAEQVAREKAACAEQAALEKAARDGLAARKKALDDDLALRKEASAREQAARDAANKPHDRPSVRQSTLDLEQDPFNLRHRRQYYRLSSGKTPKTPPLPARMQAVVKSGVVTRTTPPHVPARVPTATRPSTSAVQTSVAPSGRKSPPALDVPSSANSEEASSTVLSSALQARLETAFAADPDAILSLLRNHGFDLHVHNSQSDGHARLDADSSNGGDDYADDQTTPIPARTRSLAPKDVGADSPEGAVEIPEGRHSSGHISAEDEDEDEGGNASSDDYATTADKRQMVSQEEMDEEHDLETWSDAVNSSDDDVPVKKKPTRKSGRVPKPKAVVTTTASGEAAADSEDLEDGMNAKRGPLSADAKTDCDKAYRDFHAALRKIGIKNDKKVDSLLKHLGFVSKETRDSNPYNVWQSWYYVHHPRPEDMSPASYKMEVTAAYRKIHPEDDDRSPEQVKELFREQYEWRKSIEQSHVATTSNLKDVLRPGQAEFKRFAQRQYMESQTVYVALAVNLSNNPQAKLVSGFLAGSEVAELAFKNDNIFWSKMSDDLETAIRFADLRMRGITRDEDVPLLKKLFSKGKTGGKGEDRDHRRALFSENLNASAACVFDAREKADPSGKKLPKSQRTVSFTKFYDWLIEQQLGLVGVPDVEFAWGDLDPTIRNITGPLLKATTDVLLREQWTLRSGGDISELKGKVMRFWDMSSLYKNYDVNAIGGVAIVKSVSGRPLLTLSRCDAYQKLLAGPSDTHNNVTMPCNSSNLVSAESQVIPAARAIQPSAAPSTTDPVHVYRPSAASTGQEIGPLLHHASAQRAVSVAPPIQTSPPLPLPLSTIPTFVPHVAAPGASQRTRHFEDDGEGPPVKRPRVGEPSEPQFDVQDGMIRYEWVYPDGYGFYSIPGPPPHRGERRRTDDHWRIVDPVTKDMVPIPPGYTASSVHIWGEGSLSNDPDINDGQSFNPAIEHRYVYGYD